MIGREDDRPHGAHNDDEKHRGFILPKPQERERHPADARQRLQAKRDHADGVVRQFESRRDHPDRNADGETGEIAEGEPAQGDE
jgi:hypothetical protein